MKRKSKEEFDILRMSRRFSRKKGMELAIETRLKNNDYVSPKLIKKSNNN